MSSKVYFANSELRRKYLYQSPHVSIHTDESQGVDEPHSQRNLDGSTVIYEFKIDGMTCVACSSSIENAMRNEFEDKGLITATIALLTHKMRIEFDLSKMQHFEITPEKILAEVESIGFGGELLDTIINNQIELRNNSFGDEDESDIIHRKEGTVIKQCTFIIEGMTCSSCQQSIETHLKSLKGVQGASISLLTHKGTI